MCPGLLHDPAAKSHTVQPCVHIAHLVPGCVPVSAVVELRVDDAPVGAARQAGHILCPEGPSGLVHIPVLPRLDAPLPGGLHIGPWMVSHMKDRAPVFLSQDVEQAALSLGAAVVAGDEDVVKSLVSAGPQQLLHQLPGQIHVRHGHHRLSPGLHHAEHLQHIGVGKAELSLCEKLCPGPRHRLHAGLLLHHLVDVVQGHLPAAPQELAPSAGVLLRLLSYLAEVHDTQLLTHQDKEV